jgi:alkylhydroperoxidase family enzyme
MEARHPAAVAAGFTEDDYAAVEAWPTSDRFDEQQRLALEFAERFAGDHHAIDAMWPRLRAAFTDAELVDLAFYVGRFLAFGRLTHVLGLDEACGLAAATVPT